MKRTLIVVAAVLGLATAASAATLTVSSDKASYNVGETITLTVTGDAQGASTLAIFGELNYDAALTETVSSSQTPHTSFTGIINWTIGALLNQDGSAWVFNQIADLSTPRVPDQLQIATATLVAEATGLVNVNWTIGGPNALDFFGINTQPPAQGTSFTIVPEPTTAALLGLGLFGLALTGRRR